MQAKTRAWITAAAVAAGLTAGTSAPGRQVFAQSWNDSRAAVDACEQELQSRISREAGGRAPTPGVDFRSLDLQPGSRNTVTVNGRGTYRRDQFDRGRPYTFRCTYDGRAARATVSYSWGSGWSGGGSDEPGYTQPPSYRPGPGGGGWGGSGGSGGSSASYPPSGRVFFSGGILNRASRKGLDVEGESRADGANVQQWDFGAKANQTWEVIDLGQGEFSIVNQASGKALDVARHDASDGANVQQFRWHNGDNQRWRLERAGGGFYQIVSVSSGRCLDVHSARLNENGGNIQQWSCSGAPNQQWRLGR